MKEGIHPDYKVATVSCACGEKFTTKSTKENAPARHLLGLPSVLHRQTEADRYGRPRRQVPEKIREIASPPAALRPPFFWKNKPREVSALSEKVQIGGQAVLEGVMMRSPHAYTVAVRKGGKPDAEIAIFRQTILPIGERFPFLKTRIVRGSAALFEAMWLGIRALNFSANEALESDEDGKKEEIGPLAMAGTMIVALAFSLGLFLALPAPAHQPARRSVLRRSTGTASCSTSPTARSAWSCFWDTYPAFPI